MVFDKTWFIKNQNALLLFANSFIGHLVLRIDSRQRIDAILPNAIFTFGDNGNVKGVFRTHDKYSKRLYYGLKPFWQVLHTLDILFSKLGANINFGFDTLTAYPAAGSGGTTVDGNTARVSIDETFATIRAGAGNQAVKTTTFDSVTRLAGSTTSNQFAGLNRPIYTFDTTIVSGTINSSTFSLFINEKQNGVGDDGLHVVSATPASNNDLVNADFTTLGSTTFGSVTYAGVTTGAYVDITLNANGRANVTLGGISRFGARGAWDFNNSFTGVWASGGESRLLGYYADEAGTSSDPKLFVDYTPAGGVLPRRLGLLGVGR